MTASRAHRAGQQVKAAADATLGLLAVGMLRAIRATSRTGMADFAGGFMRRLGPRLKEHEIGRANLAAAFPEKSAAEIEEILQAVWDNLGRVAAEFAHIDRLQMFEPDPHDQGDMLYTQAVYERFKHLRDDGKPALIFAAHLANWELPALVASKYRLDTTVLYRRPNIGAVSDAIIEIRKDSMGTLVPTGLDAPLKLLRVLETGGHVAMLVDQYYVNGVDVTFFGRTCKANPLHRPARAPHRLPDPRHAGRAPAGQAALSRRPHRGDRAAARRRRQGRHRAAPCRRSRSVVEGWVREHPEQWLWVHRRWR